MALFFYAKKFKVKTPQYNISTCVYDLSSMNTMKNRIIVDDRKHIYVRIESMLYLVEQACKVNDDNYENSKQKQNLKEFYLSVYSLCFCFCLCLNLSGNVGVF